MPTEINGHNTTTNSLAVLRAEKNALLVENAALRESLQRQATIIRSLEIRCAISQAVAAAVRGMAG